MKNDLHYVNWRIATRIYLVLYPNHDFHNVLVSQLKQS